MAEPLHIIDPAGRARVASTEEDVEQARQHGSTVISPAQSAEMRQQELDREFAERNPGSAAAMGVSSGLSMGLAPALVAEGMGWIDPAAGLSAKRELRAYQESPLYTLGQVGGFLGGGFLGGPEMLAGGAAERLAARVLPEAAGVLGRTASGAIQMAARGATEGALLNLGQTASQNIIHNKRMTAESLAASGAEGALFGGLLGGGLGAAGGLARGGLSAVSRAGAGAAERGVSRGEALALKQLGAGAEDFAKLGAKEAGGVKDSLKQFHDILESKGAAFSDRSGRINEVAQETAKEAQATQLGIVRTLDREAQNSSPSIQRVLGRLENEVYQPSIGTFQQGEVQAILRGTMDKVSNVVNAPVGKSWEAWHKTRQQLSASIGADGLGSEIRGKVLNAVDDEIRGAMEGASASIGRKGLSDSYGSAKAIQAAAEHLEEMTGRKLLGDMANARGVLTPQDVGQAIGGASFGHPGWAIGMLGAKIATRKLEGAVGPALAEMAYQMSLGAKAGSATTAFQDRIQGSVRGFFGKTSRAAAFANAKAFNMPKSRDEFEGRLERAQELLSPQHQQRVRDFAQKMEQSGHAELAKQVLGLNERAVQYLSALAPPSKKAASSMTLGPQVKMKDLSMKDMKFLRVHDTLTRPHALLDRIGNGTVSKEEMDAVKFVMPEMHAGLVYAAQQEIVDMKAGGGHLPADKIVSLGILLGAPVDPMLEKDFIDAVQASFAAPEQPNPSAPPEQPVNVDNLRTPLEKAMT